MESSKWGNRGGLGRLRDSHPESGAWSGELQPRCRYRALTLKFLDRRRVSYIPVVAPSSRTPFAMHLHIFVRVTVAEPEDHSREHSLHPGAEEDLSSVPMAALHSVIPIYHSGGEYGVLTDMRPLLDQLSLYICSAKRLDTTVTKVVRQGARLASPRFTSQWHAA